MIPLQTTTRIERHRCRAFQDQTTAARARHERAAFGTRAAASASALRARSAA